MSEQTYACKFCQRTFADAGQWTSHNCDTPRTDTRRACWQAYHANRSDVWLAVDVSFAEYSGQRKAVMA